MSECIILPFPDKSQPEPVPEKKSVPAPPLLTHLLNLYEYQTLRKPCHPFMNPFTSMMCDGYNHFKFNVPKNLRKRWFIAESVSVAGHNSTAHFRMSDKSAPELAREVFQSRYATKSIFMVMDLQAEGFIAAWPFGLGEYLNQDALVKKPYLPPELRPVIRDINNPRDFKVIDGAGRIGQFNDASSWSLYSAEMRDTDSLENIFGHYPDLAHVSMALDNAGKGNRPYLLFFFERPGGRDTLQFSTYTPNSARSAYKIVDDKRRIGDMHLGFALNARRPFMEQLLASPVKFTSWRALEDHPIITKGVLEEPSSHPKPDVS